MTKFPLVTVTLVIVFVTIVDSKGGGRRSGSYSSYYGASRSSSYGGYGSRSSYYDYGGYGRSRSSYNGGKESTIAICHMKMSES